MADSNEPMGMDTSLYIRELEDKIIELEKEKDSFIQREQWCKEVEAGYEYPEKLNKTLQRLFVTMKHLEENNPELALTMLKKFWDSIIDWEERKECNE